MAHRHDDFSAFFHLHFNLRYYIQYIADQISNYEGIYLDVKVYIFLI